MYTAVFPGQGSQKPEMGRDLYETNSIFRATFDEIAVADGRNLQAICFESDEETLRQTSNAQSALYACGVSAYAAFAAASRAADFFAGHSIGEYAALAAADVISIGTGAKLVRKRGELMARAGADSQGSMAAVLGLSRETIEAVLATVAGTVVIANDNSPGQLVISGEAAAVEAASEALTAAGAKRVIRLNVSGAFHSPLMASAAEQMATALADVKFLDGAAPVISNVTTEVGRDWPSLLAQQLSSPVRWTESVEHLVHAGQLNFVEFGSGEVLCGLIRRIAPGSTTLAVYNAESLAKVAGNLPPI